MKQLTILVPDGENNLSSIVGAYKIFTRANAYWKELKGVDRFKIQLPELCQRQIFMAGYLALNHIQLFPWSAELT